MTTYTLKCNRCNHVWMPRSIKALEAIQRGEEVEIKRCPKCTSPYWNKKRQRETKNA